MRRSSIFAVAALLALTAPAFADELSDAKDLIAGAKLATETDMLMWCGAAFSIGTQMETDDAAKKTDEDLASTIFGKAAPLMLSDGVAPADLPKISEAYVVVAKSELMDHVADPEHSQEECTAAAKA